MKHVVFLGDGMADHPVAELGGKTPLEIANKPNMDKLAQNGWFGLVKTVPAGMAPGSDTANLSVFGYDPRAVYTGRSPLEAVSIGIDLRDSDVVYRCNLVTLDGPALYNSVMADYCAGEVSNAEAWELMAFLNEKIGGCGLRFYAGKSYRNCLVVHDGQAGGDYTPPHDISKKPVAPYLPKGHGTERFSRLMESAFALLADHPVNKARVSAGKNPANAIWLWGQGRKPQLASFEAKFGVKGGVISAVDLLHGIGLCAGLDVLPVVGATGNYETNFRGKGDAAIAALQNGLDFVYIHVEAPDECGHRNEIKEKVYAIEKIDADIVGPIMRYLESSGEDYSVLLAPDHATPLELLTHTDEAVPFVIYRKGDAAGRDCVYSEACAKATGVFVENGHELMPRLIGC